MATTVQGDEDDLPGDRSVIPQSVRIAMSHLDLLMLLSDRTPLDLQGFLTLLHTPVQHWPVEINLDNLSDEQSLMEDGELTSFGEYWVLHHKGLVHELQESVMRQIVDTCRNERLYDAYRLIRRTIISKPVMSLASFHRLLISPELLSPQAQQLRPLLQRVYTDAPMLVDVPLVKCPRCGYLQRTAPNGLYVCHSGQCNETRQLRTWPAVPEELSQTSEWVAVTQGIHRFITIPGIYELDMYEALTSIAPDINVEMWPRADEYDLFVEFPDGERWALDIKNWDYLGERTLERFPVVPSPSATLTAVVFPDDRKHLKIDKVRPHVEPRLLGVKLFWASEIVEKARHKAGKR
jgi:hypothetical protein